nr:hypothetical protein [Tanacetum cinerariifolium]
MERLAFCDYHNMIAILEKYEHNVDFHQIVDFVEASHIRYALTINPTVYVSHIRQFWSTARVETSDEGTKILATVDGKLRTISESSIRRNLKLNDEARISSLPDAELFENLTQMGYNISPNQRFTFQKGQFSHQWKYLIHTIMQCLSPKSTGFNEFSSNIATTVVCLATNRVYNFSKMIFDGMVQNVNNKVSKFLMYPRVNSPSFSGRTVPLFDSMLVHQGEGSGTPTKPHHTPSPKAPQSLQHDLSSSIHPPVTTTIIPTVIPTDNPPLRQYSKRARIAQFSAFPTAADEPASPLGDDSQGEACPIVSGLEAKQDRATIIKSSTLPYDSTPRVTSLAADEGSMQHKLNELMDLIKMLEDKDKGVTEPYGEDATIKGRSLGIGEEVVVKKSTKKGSNDTEELVNVLTSLDATSILASKVQVVSIPPAAEVATISVPTGSGMVPTASIIFTTASVVTPYLRRKGKEKMVESDTPKKKRLQGQIDVQVTRETEEQIAREDQRMNEQITRDAEIARIHAKEELQMLIDSFDRTNETIAKYLQEKAENILKDYKAGREYNCLSILCRHAEVVDPISWEQQDGFIKWNMALLSMRDDRYWKKTGIKISIQGLLGAKIGEETAIEKSIERGSNDTEELVNILTSLDAASMLTTGVQVVSIPPAAEVTTTKRKRKDGRVRLQEQIDVRVAREMEEKIAREDQRMNEKIFAADLSIEEMIELINDLVNYQDNYAKVLKYQSQQRKPFSKKQQRKFYMSVLKSHSRWKTKHFKGMSLKEIREKFILVWKQIEYFVPMGSKKEGEKVKRKGLRLEQESAKKVKTSKEVSEEDLKTMMQLVPVEEVYVEALQVKHLIIDWEIHIEGQRTYWKIIRLGGNTAVYQFFVDMLKHFDRDDHNQMWTLVKETLSIRQATSDKEKELWVELKRLYEPDVEDQLCTHTQALMHDQVE